MKQNLLLSYISLKLISNLFHSFSFTCFVVVTMCEGFTSNIINNKLILKVLSSQHGNKTDVFQIPSSW